MVSRLASAGAIWCLLLLIVPDPIQAQNGVSLRAAHQGSFLPEGTRIVVLARPADAERYGRLQPEFIGLENYPRDAQMVYRRDRLGARGYSETSYPSTRSSGLLYYIYAMTPDSVMYWSFSAQRDSLKYDVVSTGVMSVAPLYEQDIREDVVRRFFRQRVTVRMPGDDERPSSAHTEDADLASVARDSARDGDVDGLPVEAQTAQADSSASSLVVDDDGSSRSMDARSGALSATARPPSSAGASSSLGWLGPSILVLLISLGGAVGFTQFRKQRSETRRLRLEIISLRERTGEMEAAEALKDEVTLLREKIAEIRRELDAVKEQRRELLVDYADLQQRYAELQASLAPRQDTI